MSRAGPLALSAVGLVTASAGSVLALAFALPALGLSAYGQFSAEVTLVAEGVATALYLGGATAEVIGARLIAQHPQRAARPVVWGVVGYFAICTMFAISWPPIHGDWEGGLLVLIFGAAIVAPCAVGLLSIWVVPASPGRLRSGSDRQTTWPQS